MGNCRNGHKIEISMISIGPSIVRTRWSLAERIHHVQRECRVSLASVRNHHRGIFMDMELTQQG